MKKIAVLLLLCSCATPYHTKHFKAESRKAPGAVAYQYAEPVSPKKSTKTFLMILIPLSIPFIIASNGSRDN